MSNRFEQTEEFRVFGVPSFPEVRQPTVSQLLKMAPMTAVNNDYTKTLPRETVETDPHRKGVMNTVLIKESMSALLRDQDEDVRLPKYKIKKSDREWVTENKDNYREHIYDATVDGWRFNYNNNALDNNDRKGPFIMSRLAAMKMCESGPVCQLHNISPEIKIKHVEESDSVKANIAPEMIEKRSHDFDGMSINANNEEFKLGDLNDTKSDRSHKKIYNEEVYYPKIISSSFVKKTRRRDIYDQEM